MSSDKRSFGCVEYTIIIAICATVGVIIYASIQYHSHDTSQKVSTPSSVDGNKIIAKSSVKSSVKSSAKSSVISAAITTEKPSHHSIRYIPIHLHKGIRYVPIRLTPEGQEAD